MEEKNMDKKQNIKCDVHSCTHCDCDHDECSLREIEITKQSGCAHEKEDTICNSYEEEKDE